MSCQIGVPGIFGGFQSIIFSTKEKVYKILALNNNHGIRHFIQMLRRGESGTSALIGQM